MTGMTYKGSYFNVPCCAERYPVGQRQLGVAFYGIPQKLMFLLEFCLILGHGIPQKKIRGIDTVKPENHKIILTKGLSLKRQLSISIAKGGQFSLSAQMINPNFCVSLPHKIL